jgi:hypothetical protein
MKKLERIFLYSMLAILFFYVFLVDGNVESQVAIQEEIRAKSIEILNDEGRPVVLLSASGNGDGAIIIYNKEGTSVALVGASKDGGIIGVTNKDGTPAVIVRTAEYGNGDIVIYNKYGTPVAGMGADENDNGNIGVFNNSGEVIGNLP